MQNQLSFSDLGFSDAQRFGADESGSHPSERPAMRRQAQTDRLTTRAAGLGWLSIGLGVAELLAPKALGKMIGARTDSRGLLTLRMLGLREITTGLGILTQQRSAPWLWSRVAGDLMDLALLGRAANRRRSDGTRLLATTAAIAGITVLDGLAAYQHSRETGGEAAGEPERTVVLTKAFTINRQPSDVYAFWRDLSNQPRFMSHIASVKVDGDRSEWTARLPGGAELTWQAEIFEDRPGESIAWRSLPGSAIRSTGCVRFLPAPGGRGTEVHVEVGYEPPLGPTGFTLAKLFGAVPRQMLENDLRRLKQILETGEVVHSEASIHTGRHPARPPSDTEFAETEVARARQSQFGQAGSAGVQEEV